mmetsp:Transcript_30957/g.47795  ORF Transcript_30957/g.47795 Transcript_30957/m.47795 type:complete len:243 (+) Transcript_30957:451-1179(+)
MANVSSKVACNAMVCSCSLASAFCVSVASSWSILFSDCTFASSRSLLLTRSLCSVIASLNDRSSTFRDKSASRRMQSSEFGDNSLGFAFFLFFTDVFGVGGAFCGAGDMGNLALRKMPPSDCRLFRDFIVSSTPFCASLSVAISTFRSSFENRYPVFNMDAFSRSSFSLASFATVPAVSARLSKLRRCSGLPETELWRRASANSRCRRLMVDLSSSTSFTCAFVLTSFARDANCRVDLVSSR